MPPPMPPAPTMTPVPQSEPPQIQPVPNRYTLEEITPLIKTIVHEIMNAETTTLLFDSSDDDDAETENVDFVDLQDLRVNTVVSVLQAIPEEHSMCAVCHDDYKVADIVRKLRCKHTFHINCIDQVLEDSTTCPMCRLTIVPDDDDDE